jgi:hypothetical protein
MANVKHRFDDYEYITTIDEARVKYKEVFDLKGLYTDMHDYVVENGWASSSDKDFKEIFYHHKWLQGGMEEIRFWWRLDKEINSYYKYELDVNVRCIGIKRTEAVIDGKKFKTFTGEIEITVNPRVLADHKQEWRKHWLLKNFHRLFYKRIFFQEIDQKRRELNYEVSRFLEFLKTHFKLIKYMPEPEGEQFYTNRDFE